MRPLILLFSLTSVALAATPHSDLWLELPGDSGPGKGRRIVLISGDEEYRSEESLPQLAKILAKQHGFDCSVHFAIDPKDGTINPTIRENIPGLEKLRSADLMVIFTRFRDLPDDQMVHIADYLQAGKPVIGLRTATHAFDMKKHTTFKHYTWNSKTYDGGFGRQVLGETWINHHGQHGKQGTRGLIVPENKYHPILRGIKDGDIFGTTDVYGVRLPLPYDSIPLVNGEVTQTLKSDSPGVQGKVNNPMMPVAWVKSYPSCSGRQGRVFTTTLGASEDLLSEGTRRLLVNACYWAMNMEEMIPSQSKVDLVGDFRPLPFKFNGHKPGLKPADYAK